MITMNQMAVLANPNQGKEKRVLCVCSAGILRSATAAYVLQKEYGYNTRACGAEAEIALIPLSDALVTWADEIICMSPTHEYAVRDLLAELNMTKPVYRLDIPDQYPRMTPLLQGLVLKNYEEKVLTEH